MYTYFRFGDVELPFLNREAPIVTGPTKEAIIEAGSGGYDANGTERAPLGPGQILYAGRIIGASKAAVHANFIALQSLASTVRKLYRRDPDGLIHWIYARLVNPVANRVPRFERALDISMVFSLVDPIWHGANHDGGWSFDDGKFFDDGLVFDSSDAIFTLDASPKTIHLFNNGNWPVKAIRIYVIDPITAITSLVVYKTGLVDLRFTGTIDVAKILYIDCAKYEAWTDNVGGTRADAYSGVSTPFPPSGAHRIATWLELSPGDNEFQISWTGGSGTGSIVFMYEDGSV